MSIENKGWLGGDGSLADQMFDHMWQGSDRPPTGDRITEGPLAQFPENYDPVIVQRQMGEQHKLAMGEKQARIIGSDNNFTGGDGAGDRVVQQDVSNSGDREPVQQNPEHARGASSEGVKVDKSPTKGSRGSEVMKRIRARRAEKGDTTGEETVTRSVGGDAQKPAHGLQIKETAPVPKELVPGNLPDWQQKSSWTGSGPKAALHSDYQKVGALLKLAGVPDRELPAESLLVRLAANVKEASGPEYLMRNDVHPLKLVAELTDTLGEDWWEWEPETVRQSIVKEAGVAPSDDVMSKIMAVKIVTARPDSFFDNWMAMEKISVALNDQSPMMGAVEDVPAEWLSNAVAIVTKLAGDADFSPEVTKYVAARLYDQGYAVAPPLLRFADERLGDMVKNNALRKKVVLAYSKSLDAESLGEGEDEVSIQVARLLRNNAYVLDRLDESRSQLR